MNLHFYFERKEWNISFSVPSTQHTTSHHMNKYSFNKKDDWMIWIAYAPFENKSQNEFKCLFYMLDFSRYTSTFQLDTKCEEEKL